jgi:hypothetical protein
MLEDFHLDCEVGDRLGSTKRMDCRGDNRAGSEAGGDGIIPASRVSNFTPEVALELFLLL